MAVLFFSKNCHDWNKAVKAFEREAKPLPKKMRQTLRNSIAADRLELDRIEAAIAASEVLATKPKKAAK